MEKGKKSTVKKTATKKVTKPAAKKATVKKVTKPASKPATKKTASRSFKLTSKKADNKMVKTLLLIDTAVLALLLIAIVYYIW